MSLLRFTTLHYLQRHIFLAISVNYKTYFNFFFRFSIALRDVTKFLCHIIIVSFPLKVVNNPRIIISESLMNCFVIVIEIFN